MERKERILTWWLTLLVFILIVGLMIFYVFLPNAHSKSTLEGKIELPDEIYVLPHTGEELARLADAIMWGGGIKKSYQTLDCSIREIQILGSGYQRERTILRKFKLNYTDYSHLAALKEGEVRHKDLTFWLAPPAMRGQAILNWRYLGGKIDWWVYFPSLKNVRRLAGTDRQDVVAGGDLTYDDFVARAPEEETHTLIGYEILSPVTCTVISEPRLCYVIRSIHKEKNYYLSHRFTWIDKETFVPWREEQYDRKGRFYKILEKRFELKDGYWIQTLWNHLNLQRDFRQIIFVFDHRINTPISEAELTHDYVRKEFAWRQPQIPAHLKIPQKPGGIKE